MKEGFATFFEFFGVNLVSVLTFSVFRSQVHGLIKFTIIAFTRLRNEDVRVRLYT